MTLAAHPLFDSCGCFHETCALPPEGLSGATKNPRLSGFTLIELLVVLAIIAILTSLLLLSISGVKGSRDLSNAAYTIQGVLEQARTFAMASSTYTWVGFFEENPASTGMAGVGQLVISVVTSASGANLVTGTNAPLLPSASLTQVAKLLRIPNVHLAVVATTSVTRPAIAVTTPTDTYQVGSADFPNPAPVSVSTWKFLYPLTASTTATAQYTFTQIIQFSPQGDATRIADVPTQFIEIGLQPTHGSTITTTGTNFAVIQVAGIGGQVITYRP